MTLNMAAPPEQGIFIASSFVHAVLLVISVFHLGFSSGRGSVRGSFPAAPYDKHKHIVLSLRTAFALWLSLIPFVELIYQLRWHLWPELHQILFYTEKILSILAWMANTFSTIAVARTSKWTDFHPVDHLIQIISWIFVLAIQSVRLAAYVHDEVKSITEKYTTVITISFGILYGLTFIAFFIIDILRKTGRLLPAKQNEEMMSEGISTPSYGAFAANEEQANSILNDQREPDF